MVSRLTVAEDLAARHLALVPLTTGLPTREFFVVDHQQKHHGAAYRAMLQLLDRTFSMGSTSRRSRKDSQ
jgi:DNA-binding transcriptional LysR family regulator